jgi:flagellar FliJ protein
MQPVQRVAHNREQTAVQKLGQSQQYLDAQRARLQELVAYRTQYARDFEASSAAGLDSKRIQDYRVFLYRLDEAIRQQEAFTAQCEAQHEQTRQHWVASRSHSQAIDKVVQRYAREEDDRQQRREQREQDERSQRPTKK